MTDRDPALELIEELGPILDPLSIDYDDAGRAWQIALSEEVTVEISHDPDRGQFLLVVPLPALPEGAEREAQQMLLRYTFAMAGRNGPMAGMDETGRAVLIGRVGLAGLDVQRLVASCQAIAAAHGAWGEAFAMAAGDGDGQQATPAPHLRV